MADPERRTCIPPAAHCCAGDTLALRLCPGLSDGLVECEKWIGGIVDGKSIISGVGSEQQPKRSCMSRWMELAGCDELQAAGYFVPTLSDKIRASATRNFPTKPPIDVVQMPASDEYAKIKAKYFLRFKTTIGGASKLNVSKMHHSFLPLVVALKSIKSNAPLESWSVVSKATYTIN